MSEHATSWLVSLLRRLGYRRAILRGDGGPSIVALNTSTLLASPFVELVLRESPVGEHATNSVAGTAMREVMRQTRTQKFGLEAHVGQIVEPHSILRWIPSMAPNAISFFRIGTDGLTAEMRRSGRAWKKLVAEFGESVRLVPPSSSKRSCKWNATKAACWTVSWTPRANRQHSHHDTDGVVKVAGFRRMNEKSRWTVDDLERSSWSPLGCHRKGSRSHRGSSRPTTSNHPSAFDATSALRHRSSLEKVWCGDRLLGVF